MGGPSDEKEIVTAVKSVGDGRKDEVEAEKRECKAVKVILGEATEAEFRVGRWVVKTRRRRLL